MRIAVVGSRTFTDWNYAKKILDNWVFDGDTIISGGALGADSLARQYASRCPLVNLIEYKPDWDRYGRSAGYRRNKQIVNNSDMLIAFWDGRSKGTKHSIDLANARGIRVIIERFDHAP